MSLQQTNLEESLSGATKKSIEVGLKPPRGVPAPDLKGQALPKDPGLGQVSLESFCSLQATGAADLECPGEKFNFFWSAWF